MFTLAGFVRAFPFTRRSFLQKKIAPENPKSNNATIEKEESKFSLNDSVLNR